MSIVVRYFKCFFIALLFICLPGMRMGMSQNPFKLMGRITGYNKRPVAGVAVSAEGVPVQSITSDSGEFSLDLPSGFVWLLIKPADEYKSQRIFLNNRSEIFVQLTPKGIESVYDEIIDLNKTIRRKDLSLSFYAPDPEKFIFYPYQSLDQNLQGIVPGMLSIGFSGMPGQGVNSILRGIRSMNTNNQPLFVIDGIPLEIPNIYSSNLDGFSFNPLSSLDPMDITNITILKDSPATASYGCRASNGIIMVQTLKPTEVLTTIDFSLRTGISLAPRFIPQLNSEQYRTYANELLNSSGAPEETFSELYPGLFLDNKTPQYYMYTHSTNWQKEIFENAVINDVYLRVRGGDEIAKYGLSIGYLNHQGNIKKTSYERVSIRFVGAFNIFRWLRLNATSNLAINSYQLKESARVRQTSPILTSLFKAPFLSPYSYDDDGNQLTILSDIESMGISNPSAVINSFSALNDNYRFLTSINAEADINDRIKANSIIGINFNSFGEKIFMPNHGMELYYEDEAFNAIKSMKNHFFAIYNDTYLSYSPYLGNQHNLSASAGFRFNMNTFEEDWGVAKNSHENDEYKSLQDGTNYLREMGGANTKWNYMTSYININYGYRDKYLLFSTVSGDASSRTGKDAKGVLKIGNAPYGIFYSTGLTWRISGENFLKNLHAVEDLKLRLSYGITGNDDIGTLSHLDYYYLSRYRETSGMIPIAVSNTTLKFETVNQWNTGLDISLYAGRIRFSFDFFNSTTHDMMVYSKLPFYLGSEYMPENNGTIRNRGTEWFFSAQLLYGSKFRWNTSINISRLQNKVLGIAGEEIITSFKGGDFISRNNESLLNFYGYMFDGVIASQDEASQLNLRTDKGILLGPGDIRFRDISGPLGLPDGIINDYDKTLLGSPIPKLFGGISNYFQYGRLSLDLHVQFVSGNKVFNFLRYQDEKMTDLSNQSTHVLNRWHYDGHQTDVPRAAWDDPAGNAGFSNRWIEDGSFIRLKNATLKFTISDKILIFRNAVIYVTGTNLFTSSKYLGYDPEFNISYHTMEMGIDYGLAPSVRQYLFGIRVGL